MCVTVCLQNGSSSKEGDARTERNKCCFVMTRILCKMGFGGWDVKVMWKQSRIVTVEKTQKKPNRNLRK